MRITCLSPCPHHCCHHYHHQHLHFPKHFTFIISSNIYSFNCSNNKNSKDSVIPRSVTSVTRGCLPALQQRQAPCKFHAFVLDVHCSSNFFVKKNLSKICITLNQSQPKTIYHLFKNHVSSLCGNFLYVHWSFSLVVRLRMKVVPLPFMFPRLCLVIDIWVKRRL